MPRYRIRFDNGRTEDIDAAGHIAAIEYAFETMLDDGAEPGEEAAVYLLDAGGRGEEEYIGMTAVPSPDDPE